MSRSPDHSRIRTASTTSRKHEPIVLSLRHRKSSILSRSRSVNPPQRSASLRVDNAPPSTPPRASPLSYTRGPPESPDIWSDGISGPQGTSAAASVGEVLAGSAAVAPVRSSSAFVTAEPEAVGILRTSVSEDATPEPVAEATAELGGTVSVSEDTAAPTSAQESSYAVRGPGALDSDRGGQ